MNVPLFHVFRRKRYRIRWVPSLGPKLADCDAPTDTDKEIRLEQGLRGLNELTTVIHEGLHACLWDLDETAVEESASDIARLLWRLGYRREK